MTPEQQLVFETWMTDIHCQLVGLRSQIHKEFALRQAQEILASEKIALTPEQGKKRLAELETYFFEKYQQEFEHIAQVARAAHQRRFPPPPGQSN